MDSLMMKWFVFSIFSYVSALACVLDSVTEPGLVIDFQHIPSIVHINQLSKKEGVNEIRKFYNINDPYFNRVFEIAADKDHLESLKDQLTLIKSIVRIEGVYKAEAFSSNELPQDPFIGDQWGLFNSGQIIRKDIDDIHS